MLKNYVIINLNIYRKFLMKYNDRYKTENNTNSVLQNKKKRCTRIGNVAKRKEATKMGLTIQNDEQMKAVTGLSEEQLKKLEAVFEQTYRKQREEREKEEWEKGQRKRHGGGGRKSKLGTMREKLLFVLHYLKTYPTFQVLGATFGLSASRACQNLHYLLYILWESLVNLGVMPYREFKDAEEMAAALKGIDKLLIDAVERNHQRPEDNKKQQEMYSGKKKSTRQKTRSYPAQKR